MYVYTKNISEINAYKPYHIQWQSQNIHIPALRNILRTNSPTSARAKSINTFESTCRTSKGGATIWSFDIRTSALQCSLASKHKDWHLCTWNDWCCQCLSNYWNMIGKPLDIKDWEPSSECVGLRNIVLKRCLGFRFLPIWNHSSIGFGWKLSGPAIDTPPGFSKKAALGEEWYPEKHAAKAVGG